MNSVIHFNKVKWEQIILLTFFEKIFSLIKKKRSVCNCNLFNNNNENKQIRTWWCLELINCN